MIYQFKNGPIDGEEQDIPEMPMGAIFRYPLPEPPAVTASQGFTEDVKMWEARYRVTDIGEMTFYQYYAQ